MLQISRTTSRQVCSCLLFSRVCSQRRSLSLAHTAYEPKQSTNNTKERPIIILHGLFGSKQNNRSISRALANDLQTTVYAVDLRNHGDSPHDSTHDYESMANDVEEFVQKFRLSPVTLIGHSMGAKVAMTTAIRSPQMVRNLVSVDNAPVDAQLKTDFHKYVRGMHAILESGVRKQKDADGILEEYEKSIAIRQFLLTNLTRNNETGRLGLRIPIKILGNALDKMGDFPYKTPDGHRFEGRTLFVRGTRSHYVADDVLPLIGAFFPTFQLANIDCGHWVISEQPDIFRNAVVDFLTQTRG